MGESSASNNMLALANESKHEIISISLPIFSDLGGNSIDETKVNNIVDEAEVNNIVDEIEVNNIVDEMEINNIVDEMQVNNIVDEMEVSNIVHEMEANNIVDEMEASSIAESIEKSKSHWSQLQEFNSNNEVAKESNVKLFQTLQKHPTWGSFFMTFGESEGSVGELAMGQKFAEGSQAELYKVQIKWNDPNMMKFVQKHKMEFVLKVFKKGTFLQHLQLQWPQGLLQHHVDVMKRRMLGLPPRLQFFCAVHSGTLLEDGRFAFVMVKEDKDLRSKIDQLMLTKTKDKGPFSKDDVYIIMYEIARGMDQLHSQGIVHRDIKASNVLITRNSICLIADFESSIGVVGTGFFRAPEILEACKHRNVSAKPQLFTKAVDVYSYGMTCYEILTGKLPFEGHPSNDYDFVLQGQRPVLPSDVDDWICKLLNNCWESNPIDRPSFGEILKVLVANSTVCRERKLVEEMQELELGMIRDFSKMAKLRRSLKKVKLRLMYWLVGIPYS